MALLLPMIVPEDGVDQYHMRPAISPRVEPARPAVVVFHAFMFRGKMIRIKSSMSASARSSKKPFSAAVIERTYKLKLCSIFCRCFGTCREIDSLGLRFMICLNCNHGTGTDSPLPKFGCPVRERCGFLESQTHGTFVTNQTKGTYSRSV